MAAESYYYSLFIVSFTGTSGTWESLTATADDGCSYCGLYSNIKVADDKQSVTFTSMGTTQVNYDVMGAGSEKS